MCGWHHQLSPPTAWNILKVSWEMYAMRNLSISRASGAPGQGSLGRVQMAPMPGSPSPAVPSGAVSEFSLARWQRHHHPSGTEGTRNNIPQPFSAGRWRTWRPAGGITPEIKRQPWLSLYHSPKLVHCLGLSSAEEFNYHLSHLMHRLKKTKPTHKPKIT